MGEYFIVNKKVLPDYFEKVVTARDLIRTGAAKDVSQAVKMAGISRTTYYKYKDYVFASSENDAARKAVVSMILRHEKGILGKVLAHLSDLGANILTIAQNPPIDGRASVIITMDIGSLVCDTSDLIKELSNIQGVDRPQLLDIA